MSAAQRTGGHLHGYLSLGWLEGESLGAGAVSTGFRVSVGWPLTSPGFDDIPGSLFAPVSVPGLAGRATLPRVSLVEPALAPVSVPEVVGLLGVAGVVGLVLVSSAAGVS